MTRIALISLGIAACATEPTVSVTDNPDVSSVSVVTRTVPVLGAR